MTSTHSPSVHIEQAMPLSEMSVAQIAALPQAQLQEAHANLLSLQTMVKAVLERMHTALEQRYGDAAKAARLASGRDFGVCHLNDGDLRITVDLPKKVTWDQAQLADITRRIAASGEDPAQYVEISYRVSETKYCAWPDTLKSAFAPARTLKPGKPSFTLSVIDTNPRSL